MTEVDHTLLDNATRSVRNRLIRDGNHKRLAEMKLADSLAATMIETKMGWPLSVQLLRDEIIADYRRGLHGIKIGGRR